MPPSTDTIRILVATDNHVGFEERDPIRKDDSWRTFDEIINLARTKDVDMVLLGGDLFHDNKPSRKAMYQVIRTLRQNCLGMKPCELEFLSDASEIFDGAFGHVNYEDPDINVSIPVFSIHGNHDDPSGDGHYCSLDLLQAAGLINYFGRIPEADNIEAKPILLQKGRTKLALYGLSNVRDERMFRTFRDHKVKFFRPSQQASDFFNILTVHQNHHAHTPTSYLPENALPDWLDLVVWGHEHECLIDPQQNPETGFHVMQPGSSVATSLIPGEAVAKHVAILSITGRDFKVEKVPLKTVRPLVTREIVLSTDKQFKGLSKKQDNQKELTRKLQAVVEEMITQANEDWLSVQDEEEPEEIPLPLIRLKVEFSAPDGGEFTLENPQRFSNRFVGKVANVNDVVYFYRKKKAAARKKIANGDPGIPELEGGDVDGADVVKVEALVREYLAAQSLEVLPQGEFGDAVNQFVNKDDKNAMDNFVTDSLSNQLKDLLAMGADEDHLSEAMKQWQDNRERKFQAGMIKPRAKRKYKPKPPNWDSDMDGDWEMQPEAVLDDGQGDAGADSAAKTQQARGRGKAIAQRVLSDDDDEDVVMDELPVEKPTARPATTTSRRAAAAKPTKAAPAKKAPAKKAPARSTRGRKKGPFEDDDEDEEQAEDDMFIDDEDEPPAPAPPPKRPQRSQPAKVAATRTRQTTLTFSQSQRPTRQAQKPLEISDDEISEEEDAFESMPSTRSRRR